MFDVERASSVTHGHENSVKRCDSDVVKKACCLVSCATFITAIAVAIITGILSVVDQQENGTFRAVAIGAAAAAFYLFVCGFVTLLDNKTITTNDNNYIWYD